MNKKNIVILGSTGSIGKNAIEVVQSLNEYFNVCGIAAHSSIETLAKQAKLLDCKNVVCAEENINDLNAILPEDYNTLPGLEGMLEISTKPEVDLILCAVVGTYALEPVIEGIKAKKDIAIASKEILVMAGELVKYQAETNGVNLLPVDSEHSAIFQCLEGKNNENISKLILTASGGRFRNSSRSEIENATVEEALVHPTWNMGAKVTIDSATLMNKALEIIEAKWLFDVNYNQIDVLIHPESIIHSLVQFIDGNILAEMSTTDMKHPIQYALTYPEIKPSNFGKLNLTEVGKLTFKEPNRKIFPSLDFAYKALKEGGTLPAVLNAANETAVERFRNREIRLSEIWEIIEKVMSKHNRVKNPSLREIVSADEWGKEEANKILK